MTTEELLKKLKDQDLSAYNYVYEKYGWELHNYLKKTHPDDEITNEVFRKAMQSFCGDLTRHTTTDVLEIALCMYADRALGDLGAAPPAPLRISEPEFPLPAELPLTVPQSDALERVPVAPLPETIEFPELEKALGAYSEEADLLYPEEDPEESVIGRVGRALLVAVLLLAALAAVWTVLGLAMKMNLLPGIRWDLGYSWFNARIAPWF